MKLGATITPQTLYENYRAKVQSYGRLHLKPEVGLDLDYESEVFRTIISLVLFA